MFVAQSAPVAIGLGVGSDGVFGTSGVLPQEASVQASTTVREIFLNMTLWYSTIQLFQDKVCRVIDIYVS